MRSFCVRFRCIGCFGATRSASGSQNRSRRTGSCAIVQMHSQIYNSQTFLPPGTPHPRPRTGMAFAGGPRCGPLEVFLRRAWLASGQLYRRPAGRGPSLSEGVLETGRQCGELAGGAEARVLPRVGSGRDRPARRPCALLRGSDQTPRAPGKDDSARGASNSASPLVLCQTVEASNSGDTRDFGINLAKYQETHLNAEALFSSGERAKACHKLRTRSKRPAQHSAQNDNANDRDAYLPS